MTLCSIVLDENPLADFVELPEHLQDLRCVTHTPPPLLLPAHVTLPAAVAVSPLQPLLLLFLRCSLRAVVTCLVQIQQHLLRRHKGRARDGQHQVREGGGVAGVCVARDLVWCRVDCSVVKDPLCGDDAFELKLVRVTCDV